MQSSVIRFLFLRKYVKRQENLRKAISWWEDESENPGEYVQNPEFLNNFKIYPGLGYVDFSRRKILFDFGSFRRGSDISIRNGNSYQLVSSVLNFQQFEHLASFSSSLTLLKLRGCIITPPLPKNYNSS